MQKCDLLFSYSNDFFIFRLSSHLNSTEVNIFPLEISNPREIYKVSSETSHQLPKYLIAGKK